MKKKFSKKEIDALKNSPDWEEVEGFKAAKPTSLRLPQDLINELKMLAEIKGERSYQTLLKNWLKERADYEMQLINLGKKKKAVGE